MMEQTSLFWEKAVAFHGHECPGLAIGVRASEAAIEKLAISFADDEQVVCISENDACGVDAVSILLGCTVGKGNLNFHLTGKMAFNFYQRSSQQSLRIYFKPSMQADDRSVLQQMILAAPLHEIFTIEETKLPFPPLAKRFKSMICSACQEHTAENRIRHMDGKLYCLDCLPSYNRGLTI